MKLLWSGIDYTINKEKFYTTGYNHNTKWKLSQWNADDGSYINFDLNDNPKMLLKDEENNRTLISCDQYEIILYF